MSVEIFIALGVIAALITKSSSKVSVSDLIESTIGVIPGLIVAFLLATLLGAMSMPTIGWIGGMITAMGVLGIIVGPVILGVFYGFIFIVTAIVTYYLIKELKL